jgi:ketopantoate reductase
LIVRRGEALGVATPANRLLHANVKLIESKQRIHRYRSKPSPKAGIES